jgi:peptide methionine sulfoxide reductase msrA/msrB
MKFRYHHLSPEEAHVIEQKGTETPYSGQYETFEQKGIYLCKRCDAPLFLSDYKFHASCGWPSFDDQFEAAIETRTDQDGRRTEIICRRCHAHLGHQFTGEGYTAKNLRHCVNFLSLRFVPAYTDEGYEIAYYGAGCFWGPQYFFKDEAGVVQTTTGYMGGAVVEPTYEEICKGDTDHAEIVQVIFDPNQTTYEKMTRLFFEIHDPTQHLRQGPDVGSQYRSVIFYLTAKQKEVAESLVEQLKQKGYDIKTSIEPASFFYEAENFHQDYYNKMEKKPYCHRKEKRF